MFRIRRPDLKPAAATGRHASEIQVFDVDGEFVNGDLATFLDAVEALVP